jgi:hypothetical protein
MFGDKELRVSLHSAPKRCRTPEKRDRMTIDNERKDSQGIGEAVASLDRADAANGDADMSESGVELTRRNDGALAEEEASSDERLPEVDAEFKSEESMARVRETYRALTDAGVQVRGEGEIPEAGGA